jgi:hypothetical protein
MWREEEEDPGEEEGLDGGGDLNGHADPKVRDRDFVAIHRIVVILKVGRSET